MEHPPANVWSYVAGFALSLALTTLSFGALFWHDAHGHRFPTHPELLKLFIVTAIAQLFVQLYFFLHLGRGKDARVNALFAALALFIVAVIVGGSLWIMSHLQHMNVDAAYSNGVISPQHEQD